jgi:hypothetical protein
MQEVGKYEEKSEMQGGNAQATGYQTIPSKDEFL